MSTSTANYKITWEKLPDDFVLDDEPVDNINQPSLAAALTESLDAGKLPANALTTTNYGICASESKDGCESPRLGIHTIYSGSEGTSQAQLYSPTPRRSSSHCDGVSFRYTRGRVFQ